MTNEELILSKLGDIQQNVGEVKGDIRVFTQWKEDHEKAHTAQEAYIEKINIKASAGKTWAIRMGAVVSVITILGIIIGIFKALHGGTP